MKIDGKGNRYNEIKNQRISYIKSGNRKPDKDWPGVDVIRIQAYKGGNTNSLHLGAEMPIEKKEDIIDVIRELLEIHKILDD